MVALKKTGSKASKLVSVTPSHVNMEYAGNPVSVTVKETALVLKIASKGKPGLEAEALPTRDSICADRSDLRVVDSLIKMKGVLYNADGNRVGFSDGIGKAVCTLVMEAKKSGEIKKLAALPASTPASGPKTGTKAATPVTTSGKAAAAPVPPVKKKFVIKRKASAAPAAPEADLSAEDNQEDNGTESETRTSDSDMVNDAAQRAYKKRGYDGGGNPVKPATYTFLTSTLVEHDREGLVVSFPGFLDGGAEFRLNMVERDALLLVARDKNGAFDAEEIAWVDSVEEQQRKALSSLCRKTLVYVAQADDANLYYRLSFLGRNAAVLIHSIYLNENKKDGTTLGKYEYDAGSGLYACVDANPVVVSPGLNKGKGKAVTPSEPGGFAVLADHLAGKGSAIPPATTVPVAAETVTAPAVSPEKAAVEAAKQLETLSLIDANAGTLRKSLPARLNFVINGLVKSGHLANNAGTLTLTPEGNKLYQYLSIPSPADTDEDEQEADPFGDTAETPEETADEAEEATDVIDPLAAEMESVENSTATVLKMTNGGQAQMELDGVPATGKKKFRVRSQITK